MAAHLGIKRRYHLRKSERGKGALQISLCFYFHFFFLRGGGVIVCVRVSER